MEAMLQQDLIDSVWRGRLFHYICLLIPLIFFSHWMFLALHLSSIYMAREYRKRCKKESIQLGRKILSIFIQQSINRLYPHQIFRVALKQLAQYLSHQEEYSPSFKKHQHHLPHLTAITQPNPLVQEKHQLIYINWSIRKRRLCLSSSMLMCHHLWWIKLQRR